MAPSQAVWPYLEPPYRRCACTTAAHSETRCHAADEHHSGASSPAVPVRGSVWVAQPRQQGPDPVEMLDAHEARPHHASGPSRMVLSCCRGQSFCCV